LVGESNPRASKPTLHHFGTLIQTDAKLPLGTSGGALLNLDGEKGGLTTAMAAGTRYDQAARHPAPGGQAFRRLLEAVKRGQEVEYGMLGISPQSLSFDEVRRGVRGARVASVDPSSPARRAGLLTSDIVTAVNGQAIDDEDGLMLHIGRLPPTAP